jgi:glutaredoxin
MTQSRWLAPLGLAALAVLAACKDSTTQRIAGSIPIPWPSGGSEPGASAGDSQHTGGDLASIEGESTKQVFYQYVDERGGVMFVPRLADVPEQWRDRVGFVEMDVPAGASARHGSLPQRARTPAATRTASAESSSASQPEIILYSADWCPACQKAKAYMDEQSIAYEERNIDEPEWRVEMERTAGPGGIPVFDIEGKILRGFSAQQLQQVLGRG